MAEDLSLGFAHDEIAEGPPDPARDEIAAIAADILCRVAAGD